MKPACPEQCIPLFFAAVITADGDVRTCVGATHTTRPFRFFLRWPPRPIRGCVRPAPVLTAVPWYFAGRRQSSPPRPGVPAACKRQLEFDSTHPAFAHFASTEAFTVLFAIILTVVSLHFPCFCFCSTSPLAHTAACYTLMHSHCSLVRPPLQVSVNSNLADLAFPNLTSVGQDLEVSGQQRKSAGPFRTVPLSSPSFTQHTCACPHREGAIGSSSASLPWQWQ